MKIGDKINTISRPSGGLKKLSDFTTLQLGLKINVELYNLILDMMDHNEYTHLELKRFLNENR